jgi:hypothetical protein
MRSHLTFTAGLALALAASAQSYTYTKVADTATAVPSGSGNFTTLTNMVSVDSSGNVGFGENGASNKGIYFWNGTALTRAADLNTAIPAGTGNFTGFATFGNGMGGGRVVFRGSGGSGQTGLYAYDSSGSTLTRIADTSTAIPSGSGNFGSFTTGFIDGANYTFIASTSDFSQQGIYVSDGTTATRVADKTSTVPGIGGTYAWSSQVAADGGNQAFWANITGGSQPGGIIGSASGGTLYTLASLGTTAPGAGTAFTGFTSPPDLDGSDVYFRGAFAGGNGLYEVPLTGGAVARIADTTFLAPGTGANFTSFNAPAADADRLLFTATYTGGSGLFLYDGSTISTLLTTGGTLDGKTISALFLSPDGVAGDYLAFRANFTDSSSGIFRTSLTAIPEPSTSALLAGLGVLGLARWRRRPAA